MMLGFKRQFETYVEEGSKTHSIRAKGGRDWKRGDVADCFVNPRQKTMRLLGRFPVVKVDDIRIFIVPMSEWITVAGVVYTAAIEINGERLSLDECNVFAWRDGFRGNESSGAFLQMLGFWNREHGLAKPFEGVVIHWAYSKALAGRLATKAASRAAARALGVAA